MPETSSQDIVREAYIKLVKQYHPDSGTPEASKDKFTEIDSAFRILQEKYAKNRRGIDDDQHNIDEAKVFDIRVSFSNKSSSKIFNVLIEIIPSLYVLFK